eukprot:141476-Chlamydomonas_euryale.AAC.1
MAGSGGCVQNAGSTACHLAMHPLTPTSHSSSRTTGCAGPAQCWWTLRQEKFPPQARRALAS